MSNLNRCKVLRKSFVQKSTRWKKRLTVCQTKTIFWKCRFSRKSSSSKTLENQLRSNLTSYSIYKKSAKIFKKSLISLSKIKRVSRHKSRNLKMKIKEPPQPRAVMVVNRAQNHILNNSVKKKIWISCFSLPSWLTQNICRWCLSNILRKSAKEGRTVLQILGFH